MIHFLNMSHSLFYLALTFLIMHEMDAIRCKEWRIFPGLTFFDDSTGFQVFTFAHIPLFFFIFKGLNGANKEQWIFGLDIFLIVHVMLHVIYLKHKRNEFTDWVSWTIISCGGIFGLTDLLLTNYL